MDNTAPLADLVSEDKVSNVDLDDKENAFTTLRSWRVKNSDRITLGSLNINSIPKKIDDLRTLVTNNLDILVVQETKIDDTFSNESIQIPGYEHKPFRRDRKLGGGGIITYVREDIPSKAVNLVSIPDDIEGVFIELNFRKAKWLLFSTYLPPWQNKTYYFEELSKALDVYGARYDNIILVGDFNTKDSEEVLSDFLFEHDLDNLVSFPTCYQNALNPNAIDLFLTNKSKCFQHTMGLTTGLSDHHKMIATSFKMTFPKSKPKEKLYRAIKNCDRDLFRNELKSELEKIDSKYESFEDTFTTLLDKHAPMKKKILRANEKPYVTKAMRKAIMKRSELATKYRRNPTEDNLRAWKKHKNFCSNLYKKERKTYYESLDMTNLTDNRKFWKTVKPLFSDKAKGSSNITLIENKKVITSEKEVAETLNKHFIESVKELVDKDSSSSYITEKSTLEDPLARIKQKFRYHPSILSIQKHVTSQNFSFEYFSDEDLSLEIMKMKSKKASTGIPIKFLKENVDIVCPKLKDILNNCLDRGIFPNRLKLADISPIFKANDSTLKKNYRPVSVLNIISKLFEKLINKQFVEYVEQHLSPYLCGYRKGYSTQYALLSLIEKWKHFRDRNGYSAAILMDLSKAFDTINHDLLIAKLHSYGVGDKALRLFMDYLNNRWQRTKVNGTYSTWAELLYGVPQGSILGPLLFNIYLNDLFLEIGQTNICNFADDTTPHASGYELNEVLINLEHDSNLILEWFRDNYMTLNEGKCHLLVCGYKHECMFANIGNTRLWEEHSAKLLGVHIDSELNFKFHVKNICKNAGRKISMLSRIAQYLSESKRKILMKTFFESLFSYCPLIWMFCDRTLNAKINRLHERALRIAYNDYISSFEDLLVKDGSVTIHEKNLRSLVTEMFKIKNKLSPPFICDLVKESNIKYQTRSHYSITENEGQQNIDKKHVLTVPKVYKVKTGTESFSNVGPILWNSLPEDVKNADTLASFKSKVKELTFDNCPCSICKTYIQGVGYLD